MPLYHFQNFPGFLRAVLFSAFFPAPYSSSYLAWALLASPAAGSARGSVPQGITLWVEAPMVNPAPREGLWVSGLVPPWLLSIRVSQQAHSPLQARPLSPPHLGSVLCFALRLSTEHRVGHQCLWPGPPRSLTLTHGPGSRQDMVHTGLKPLDGKVTNHLHPRLPLETLFMCAALYSLLNAACVKAVN